MATAALDPTSQLTSQLTSRPTIVVVTTEEGNAKSIPSAEAESEVAFLRVVVAECTTIQAALENIKKAAIARLAALTQNRDVISY